MLCLQIGKIFPARPGSSGLVFETRIVNNENRMANVVSFDFELWLGRQHSSEVDFMGKLSPDSFRGYSEWAQLGLRQEWPFNLSWHYTAKDLQKVEDRRNGGSPLFEIRGQVGIISKWTNNNPPPSFAWEQVHNLQGGFPIRFPYSQSDWVELLNQIGFRNIMLYELPAPPFPPGFARSQELLENAWKSHRAAKPEEALQHCFKAFECLGFNLLGAGTTKRDEILAHLLADAPIAKKETIGKLWASLSDFLHLGRHERGETVELSVADSEMALVCATSLLRYLAALPRG